VYYDVVGAKGQIQKAVCGSRSWEVPEALSSFEVVFVKWQSAATDSNSSKCEVFQGSRFAAAGVRDPGIIDRRSTAAAEGLVMHMRHPIPEHARKDYLHGTVVHC
jgi:hypothetical protein